MASDPLLRARKGELRRFGSDRHGVGTAIYSSDEQYRYRLSRVWDPVGDRVCFLMLNPSTATEVKLDPTVTRCMNSARAWGYGSAEVVNIFAWRSTDPRQLKLTADPIGPGNDRSILSAARGAALIVAAWGSHGSYLDRATHVADMVTGSGNDLHALAYTAAGQPRHPLYLPGNLRPTLWMPAR